MDTWIIRIAARYNIRGRLKFDSEWRGQIVAEMTLEVLAIRVADLERKVAEISVAASRAGVNAQREPRETPVQEWRYLARRQHPWRKQLYVKGRNLTARQLVGGIRANGLDEEKAADNYDLPVEAVREALAYV